MFVIVAAATFEGRTDDKSWIVDLGVNLMAIGTTASHLCHRVPDIEQATRSLASQLVLCRLRAQVAHHLMPA